jgi:endoglucanase
MKCTFPLKATGSFLVAVALAVSASAQAQQIRLNQLGFLPGQPKQAVIIAPVAASDFFVIDQQGNDTVFRGHLGGEHASAFSSLHTRLANFTALQKEGKYTLAVPGIGNSQVFAISRAAYDAAAVAVIKAYYIQRMSLPILAKYAGKWSRAEGHPDTQVFIHPSAADALRPEGYVIASPGGWYDAGDYNKYVVNSGITMGTLFSVYEDFPSYFGRQNLNIPESKDAIPDLLNEALYNLRWMLTMQDPNDGGVYHKCTNAVFDPMIMPDKATKPRFVVQKSTAAALDFAAVTAQASRIFRKWERSLPGLSDSCLAAARRAWKWAQLHPDLIYDQREMNRKFDPDITTGDYGDRNLNDEWLWAAAELYVTAKEQPYLDIVKEHMKDRIGVPSWGSVALMGYYSVVHAAPALPGQSAAISLAMKDSIIRLAERLLANEPASAFGTVMGQSSRDFIWGSNAVAANQGMLLVKAYLLTNEHKFLDGAFGNLDYLLGRNATGYCFVTGFGTHSPMHPHHRLSVADGIVDPVPGWLVGGPNPGRQDKCIYPLTETETSYVDSDCAYACNEVAINWNAPIVYLLNSLVAMEKKTGVRKP